MTRTLRTYRYEPGSYDQRYVAPGVRLPDEAVGAFINEWMRGKNTHWIGRQFKSETGRPMGSRAVRAHGRRLELQGIIPAGTGDRPQEHHLTGAEPEGWSPTHKRTIVQQPGCGWETPRRVGRPSKGQERAAAGIGLDGQPITEAPQTGLDWHTQRRLRLEREEREAKDLLSGVTAPIDTPAPPSLSPPAADEDRIRGHGAADELDNRATKLRLDTSSTQEEGTTNASTQERPPDPTRPADQAGIDEAPQTPAGEARRVTPRPRRQRRTAGEGEPPQHQPRQQRRNARIRQGPGQPQGEPGASSGDSGED